MSDKDLEKNPAEEITSGAAEKTNKKSDVAVEVKLKRDLLAANELAEKQAKEIQSLREKMSQPVAVATPDMALINQLKGQIDQLSQQVNTVKAVGTGLVFKKPTAEDTQKEKITFTSRSVIYIVASYRDANGIEHLPPFKLIVFEYAASDVKKEGKEETILNFSQFTTNLKPEIEFLRNHPFYNIAYSENTNSMAKEDVQEIAFRVQAATQLGSASAEQLFERAEYYNIPNWRSMSAASIRPIVLNEMTKQFKKENEALQENILRNMELYKLGINKE
jgi:hypothetical protein